jgi:hypothetical protein
MLTGAGSPATGGPTGEQQTGGGCRAGFAMLSAFGMKCGWCVVVPAPADPVDERSATAPRTSRIRIFLTVVFPLT